MKPNSHISEKKLVFLLTEGDEKAFCKLYSLYRAQLTFFAFKFLKSSAYTEDIVQETFLHVWLSRNSSEPTSLSLPTYTPLPKTEFLTSFAAWSINSFWKSIC